jgi:hypothetical protein
VPKGKKEKRKDQLANGGQCKGTGALYAEKTKYRYRKAQLDEGVAGPV